MDCPKCLGKLEKQTMEQIEINSCSVCEGIWFDAGELKDILKKDSKNFHYLDVGREIFDAKEAAKFQKALDAKSGTCPRCSDGTILARDEYQGKHTVNIDVCPRGHGLWLDGGEIEALRKRGLVKLRNLVEFELDLLRYAFSADGFRQFMSKVSRRSPPTK